VGECSLLGTPRDFEEKPDAVFYVRGVVVEVCEGVRPTFFFICTRQSLDSYTSMHISDTHTHTLCECVSSEGSAYDLSSMLVIPVMAVTPAL